MAFFLTHAAAIVIVATNRYETRDGIHGFPELKIAGAKNAAKIAMYIILVAVSFHGGEGRQRAYDGAPKSRLNRN